MAIRWPSRVDATLTIRNQSSREAVQLPRHLRHQGLRHRRRFLVSQDLVKTRIVFEKTEFPCSSTCILIWWLSSKPGRTSTTVAKPRRLPKTESTCSFKSALIFALPQGAHCPWPPRRKGRFRACTERPGLVACRRVTSWVRAAPEAHHADAGREPITPADVTPIADLRANLINYTTR